MTTNFDLRTFSIKPSPSITEFLGGLSCAPEKFDHRLFNTDLLAILDVEEIDKTAIICQSMGGWTGLQTAVYHPERGSCLALSITPGGIKIPTVAAALTELSRVFAERGLGTAAVADGFTQEILETAFLYRQIGLFNINLPVDLSNRNPAEIHPDEMDGYCVATLMITSEHYQKFTPNLIREVSKHIPDS